MQLQLPSVEAQRSVENKEKPERELSGTYWVGLSGKRSQFFYTILEALAVPLNV